MERILLALFTSALVFAGGEVAGCSHVQCRRNGNAALDLDRDVFAVAGPVVAGAEVDLLVSCLPRQGCEKDAYAR